MPSTESNALNAATTGIVGNTGTSFTGTAVTNHAVIVGGSTSSTLTNVGPTATSGQVLQSAGSSADPAFSTATYPVSTTINQILYSSSANVVAGLSTVNSAVLSTTSGGVPQLLSMAADGDLLIGSSAGAPTVGTLTAGTGISVTNGHNSITIAAGSGVAQTFNGDSGSATPSSGTLTIKSGQSTNNSGNSVTFSGSGSTLTLNLTDGSINTFIGNTCGNTATGQRNAGFGAFAMNSATGTAQCVGFGSSALSHLVNGAGTIGIGFNTGSNYTGSESNNIVIGSSIGGTTGENNVIRLGNASNTSCYITGIAGASYSAGSPTPYLTYLDTSDGQLTTPTPASSHAVIVAFGSITLGTAKQNTSAYAIHVNINIVATAATAATIIMGVGSTNTPTTDTVWPSFTVAAASNYAMSALVPAGFYLLVNTTGTITVGSTTTWSCAVG